MSHNLLGKKEIKVKDKLQLGRYFKENFTGNLFSRVSLAAIKGNRLNVARRKGTLGTTQISTQVSQVSPMTSLTVASEATRIHFVAIF